MKGLLIKDLYNLAGMIKIYLIMPVMMILLSYMQHSVAMLEFMPAFIGMFLTVSAYAYDEQCGFDTFAMSLPVRRQDMVLSKYILAIISILGCMFVTLLLGYAMAMVLGASFFEDFELTSFIAESVMISAAMLFVNAFMLPLIVKYGSQKARVCFILIFLCIGFLGGFVVEHMEQLFGSGWLSLLKNMKDFLIPLLLVGSMIAMGLSFVCSIHFIKQKEF